MLQSKLQSCKLSQKSWSVELSLLFDLLFSCGLAWIELSLFFVSKIIFTEVGPGYFIILWFCSPKHALLACWVVPCTNLSMPISYWFYFVFFNLILLCWNLTWAYALPYIKWLHSFMSLINTRVAGLAALTATEINTCCYPRAPGNAITHLFC